VGPDGRVKLLDFGLAKLGPVAAGGKGVSFFGDKTTPGTILGTVGYMSPEQAGGEETDFRTDIFSFGALFYEMVSGRVAFDGKTDVDKLTAILRDEPASLSRVAPAVPAPVRWISERCLHKEPSERYASTRDLFHDLSLLEKELQSTEPGTLRAAP